MEKVAFDQFNVPVFPHMLSQYMLGRVYETLFQRFDRTTQNFEKDNDLEKVEILCDRLPLDSILVEAVQAQNPEVVRMLGKKFDRHNSDLQYFEKWVLLAFEFASQAV